MNIDILLVNAVVYIATLIFAILKFKRLNLYVIIWFAYSVVTLMGYISVKLNMHYSEDPDLGLKLPLTPYVCAYFTTVLLTYPFYRIRENKFRFNISFPKWLLILIKLSAYIFVILTIISAVTAYIVANTIGFGEAYVMGHEGEYVDIIGDNFIVRVIHYLQVATNAVKPFYIVYYFNQIVQKHRKFWANILMILLAFMPETFSAIAGGSKGTLFFTMLNIVFYFVFWGGLLATKEKKKLTSVAIFVGIFMSFYVVTISLSRFEAISGSVADKTQQQNEIVHYLGESYPNLGYFFYGKVKKHPNGRRFFPEFFKDNPENQYKYEGIDGKFSYWNRITKVPMEVFKTTWGDWYVEYGFWESIVALIIVFFIFYKFWLRDYGLLSNIGIVAFYYSNVVIRGCFSGSGLEGTQVHNTLILILVFSYLLRKEYIKQNI